MAGFNVRVDASSVKAIEQALKELPLELKSGAVATAQINAASVLRNEAKRLGKQLGGSGSWSKSQHVVRGNVKRYSPYVVLKTANKRFSVRPVTTFMDAPSPTTFAPVKYNHLIQKGSAPQVRTQILENMSSRQREAILDDLEALGQVKASDIEKAQNEIARIAIRMIEQERISPPG